MEYSFFLIKGAIAAVGNLQISNAWISLKGTVTYSTE